MKILIVGDIPYQHRLIKSIEKYNYSFDEIFSNVKQLFSQYDLVIGNFEFCVCNPPYEAITNDINNHLYGVHGMHIIDIRFFTPPEFADAIVRSGVNVINCANNHIMDKGIEGYEMSYKKYNSLGNPWMGLYKNKKDYLEKTPLIIEKCGYKIGLITFTTCRKEFDIENEWIVPSFQKEDISKQVKKCHENNVNFIIAYAHWGNDYQEKPTQYQIKIKEYLEELGVQVIVGTHSHVPQEYKLDGKSIVCYGLGNLLCASAQNRIDAFPNTTTGLLLSLDIDNNQIKPTIIKSKTIKKKHKYLIKI